MDRNDLRARLERMGLEQPQTVNALDMLAAVDLAHVPNDVSLNSSDGGVSMHWSGFEVAIFADRYETYRFSDGETAIRHWPRLPGQPLDDLMLSEVRQMTGGNAS